MSPQENENIYNKQRPFFFFSSPELWKLNIMAAADICSVWLHKGPIRTSDCWLSEGWRPDHLNQSRKNIQGGFLLFSGVSLIRTQSSGSTVANPLIEEQQLHRWLVDVKLTSNATIRPHLHPSSVSFICFIKVALSLLPPLHISVFFLLFCF